VNVVEVIVAGSIAVENVACTGWLAPTLVAPAAGEVEVTVGAAAGAAVENVHVTAAGSGVPSEDCTAVVSRAV
jgi:hypothetical protein